MAGLGSTAETVVPVLDAADKSRHVLGYVRQVGSRGGGLVRDQLQTVHQYLHFDSSTLTGSFLADSESFTLALSTVNWMAWAAGLVLK